MATQVDKRNLVLGKGGELAGGRGGDDGTRTTASRIDPTRDGQGKAEAKQRG